MSLSQTPPHPSPTPTPTHTRANQLHTHIYHASGLDGGFPVPWPQPQPVRSAPSVTRTPTAPPPAQAHHPPFPCAAASHSDGPQRHMGSGRLIPRRSRGPPPPPPRAPTALLPCPTSAPPPPQRLFHLEPGTSGEHRRRPQRPPNARTTAAGGAMDPPSSPPPHTHTGRTCGGPSTAPGLGRLAGHRLLPLRDQLPQGLPALLLLQFLRLWAKGPGCGGRGACGGRVRAGGRTCRAMGEQTLRCPSVPHNCGSVEAAPVRPSSPSLTPMPLRRGARPLPVPAPAGDLGNGWAAAALHIEGGGRPASGGGPPSTQRRTPSVPPIPYPPTDPHTGGRHASPTPAQCIEVHWHTPNTWPPSVPLIHPHARACPIPWGWGAERREDPRLERYPPPSPPPPPPQQQCLWTTALVHGHPHKSGGSVCGQSLHFMGEGLVLQKGWGMVPRVSAGGCGAVPCGLSRWAIALGIGEEGG